MCSLGKQIHIILLTTLEVTDYLIQDSAQEFVSGGLNLRLMHNTIYIIYAYNHIRYK